jgi:predicted amidohydrolase YtcJ
LREALPQRVDSLSTHVNGHLPCKIVIADHEPASLDQIIAAMRLARERGRAVAVHAVTAAALALAIAALDVVGAVPGDRIEHAAVCDDDAADRLAEIGVTVVTQPTLWRRRCAEFLAETPESERHLLWRHGSLRARGVAVAVGSDAPYGGFDPWRQIEAAARREPAEAVDPATTLKSLVAHTSAPAGPARRIVAGAEADLVLLDAPLDRALAEAALSGRTPVARVYLGRESVAGPAGL